MSPISPTPPTPSSAHIHGTTALPIPSSPPTSSPTPHPQHPRHPLADTDAYKSITYDQFVNKLYDYYFTYNIEFLRGLDNDQLENEIIIPEGIYFDLPEEVPPYFITWSDAFSKIGISKYSEYNIKKSVARKFIKYFQELDAMQKQKADTEIKDKNIQALIHKGFDQNVISEVLNLDTKPPGPEAAVLKVGGEDGEPLQKKVIERLMGINVNNIISLSPFIIL